MKIFVSVIHDNDFVECMFFPDIDSFLEFADDLTFYPEEVEK